MGMFTFSQRGLSHFAKRFSVELIILFGSSVDTRRAPKDIDIALLLPDANREKYEKDIGAYTDLWRALGKALGVSEDLLDITFISPKTPPLLLYYIARDGKLLYGKYSQFISLRVKAMKIFFDTARFRHALDQYLRKKIYAR